jgi:hypothetical protein
VCRRRLLPCAAGLAAIAVLAGCSGQGSSESGLARDVASRFVRAQVQDVERACALLAPKTLQEVQQDGQCTTVLAGEAPSSLLTVKSVQVWGTNAVARFEGDTVFLARFRDGWKVVAAGCQPDGKNRPYQCDIQAG